MWVRRPSAIHPASAVAGQPWQLDHRITAERNPRDGSQDRPQDFTGLGLKPRVLIREFSLSPSFHSLGGDDDGVLGFCLSRVEAFISVN